MDGEDINDVYKKIDSVKDKLIRLIWRNDLNENKVVKSMDGKEIQVLCGVVPIKDRTSQDNEISVNVKFPNDFGGKKQPSVVAMPQGRTPYGCSVTNVDRQGFTLILHQFGDQKDNTFGIVAINYIAVGMP